MHVTLLITSPKITKKCFVFFGRTSLKKMHETVCIAIFIFAQHKKKKYFTKLYYMPCFLKFCTQLKRFDIGYFIYDGLVFV